MPRLEMLETAADCAENNWTKWGNRAERTWIYVFIAQNPRYNLQVANQFPETDKSHQHVISATISVVFIEMSLFSLSLSSLRLYKSGTFADHLKSTGERGDYDENMKRALGLWGRCGGHVVSRSKCLLAGLLASQRSFNRKSSRSSGKSSRSHLAAVHKVVEVVVHVV